MKRLLITILAGVVAGGLLGLVWAQENPPVVKTLQRTQSKVNAATAPAATPAPPAPATEAAAAPVTPAAPGTQPKGQDDNYLMEGEVLYRHQTERDPFSPLVRGLGGGPVGKSGEVKTRPCPPGHKDLCQYTVEECNLEAVLRTPAGVMAWFQGPDNKAYKIIAGERFADGIVLDVNYDSGEVTIQQELTDSTSVKPFRNLVLKIRKQEGEGQ